MRRFLVLLAAAVALGLVVPAGAMARPFPDVIPLPNGFAPEGIAVGTGHTFFVGSIPTGAIYRGDLRTGQGEVLVEAGGDRMAIGVAEAGGRLYVAGGPTGQAFIYDAETGEELATHELASEEETFVNDVVVTRRYAFFTDSFQPELYRVDRATGDVTALPLHGDISYVEGEFNANGIDATPNGKTLILVQSITGKLFTADPDSGSTEEIDLGGGAVPNGDGILLHGRDLYVVQNQLNQVAVVSLSPDLSSGEVVERVTHPEFDVPTTIARFGSRLYAANARFGTPVEDDTEYDVVGFPRP